MFAATRRWFRRNRTPIAVGVGVVGAGYVVTQYVLSKINDARERMSSERIAKENLRRRFEQNQEDCTFTVLALLPTATTNILEAMNTEKITLEIQQMKGGSARSVVSGSGDSVTNPPSLAGDAVATDEDGRSMVSMPGEVAALTSAPSAAATAAAGTAVGESAPEGGAATPQKKKTKRQLWDDLTISSITRAFTLLYTLSLLTLLTRVQLNLLGRRSYLSSVVSLATGSPHAPISLENNDDDNTEQMLGSDFDVNRKYLTLSWWLLNRGWIELSQRVEAAVREVFGSLSPRDLLSLERFRELSNNVRRIVEYGSPNAQGSNAQPAKWLSYLLPPPDMEDYVIRESGILTESTNLDQSTVHVPSPTSSASLRRLVDETADLIESPTFAHVLDRLLNQGFSVLLDGHLAPAVFDVPAPAAERSETDIALLHHNAGTKVVLLPKILSVLTRQAHAIGSGLPNEYLREMETVRELEAFAAVVYSSNFEYEIHGGAAAAAAVRNGDDLMASAVHVQPPVVSAAPSGSESLVVVNPSQNSFESAWERATEAK